MRLFKALKRRVPLAQPPDAPPRVLVACPDHSAPAGGVRQLYRLVAGLREELKLDAYVYHHKTGFRQSWFESLEPMLYEDATAPGANDILVVPEVWGCAIMNYPGVRKVIFNQNAYYTFMNGYELPPSPVPLNPRQHSVRGILTVSDDSAQVLRHNFPDIPVARLHYHIDPAHFHSTEKKQPRIVYMPRKHPDEARQVLNILALRGALRGIEVVPIDGLCETDTAAILRTSLIFLSFGYPEGFSLPPAEAMACGCLTIGYHGQGAREFMLPRFSWPIETGDILGFARTVEAVLDQWRQEPASLRTCADQASAFIHHRYSKSAHRQSLREAWGELSKHL